MNAMIRRVSAERDKLLAALVTDPQVMRVIQKELAGDTRLARVSELTRVLAVLGEFEPAERATKAKRAVAGAERLVKTDAVARTSVDRPQGSKRIPVTLPVLYRILQTAGPDGMAKDDLVARTMAAGGTLANDPSPKRTIGVVLGAAAKMGRFKLTADGVRLTAKGSRHAAELNGGA